MSGYTRQSVADIIPTAVVRSAPVNAEFNALRDAFTALTGHSHDGSTGEGAYVPLIGDVDANNKVSVNTVNNRIEVFAEVSSSPVAQVYFQDGVFLPVADNDIDLGTSTLEFKNLFLDGIAKIDTLTVDENATVAGTLGVTGLSTLASVAVSGGTINSTVIGGSTPQAITGTNITATTGFSGPLTGNVTGNLTGNVTGNVTGNLTGNVTGNITASSGSSSFNDLTINGSLNMNSGTAGTVTGLSAPVNGTDAATKTYVDTSISNLIDTAPGTLDTLNELAAALGDDPNFATTVTTQIATKVSKAGDTMSGALAMGTNRVTGLGDPVSNQDATTKIYVDNADATKLNLSGGTMTGNLSMGANKVTSTASPTADDDLTRKGYVDNILGSATSAAASAAAAAISETNAASSASSALTSANNAAASFDSFDDRYLGAKASPPTVDNDGNALLVGALYWGTSANQLYVWDGSAWDPAAFSLGSALVTADIGITVQAWDADLDVWATKTAPSGTVLGSNDIGTSVQAWDADLDVWATKTAPSGTVLGSNDTQTLTNKTISVDNNTVSGIANSSFVLSNSSGNIDGSAAQKAIPAGVVVGTTDTQTLSGKTLERAVLNDGYTEEVFAITDGATVNLDPNDGSIQTWTLGASRTPGQANWAAGQTLTLLVDDGSAHTITWSTLAVVWKTDGGVAPTLETTGVTVIVLWKVDTTIYGARVGDK